MSSTMVDQRIVQMEFDNKRFEANAKESISTLEKLKQSLNLEDSAKGFDKLSSSASKIDLSSIANSLDTVSNRFSTLGIVGMTVLQRLTNAALDFGTGLLKKVMAPLNIIKTGGWQRALNVDTAMFKMSGILKDDFEENQALIKETIDYAVSGTAYSYDAAASAMSQFVASGVEFRGETMNMKNALRAISGVASMTGSSYEEIAHIFTKVAGTGKLMGEELTMLSERGLAVKQTLAEYLKISEDEVAKKIKQGKMSFQEFVDVMDKAYGEHAKKANDTFQGAYDNIRAALKRTGEPFGRSVQTMLKDIFNSIRPNINAFNKQILGPISSDFDTVTKVISKKVQSIFGDAESGPKVFIGWMSIAFRSIENIILGLLGMFDAAKKAFHGIFPKPTIDSIANFWAGVVKATSKFRDAFTDARKFADPFVSILGEAKDTVEDTVAAAQDLEEIAKRVISGEFGNGQARFKALEELGYSYKLVQNKVNEMLGCNYRYELSEEELAKAEQGLAKAQQKKNVEYTEAEKRFLRMEKALHGMTEEDEARIGSLHKVVKEDKKRHDILDNITDTAKIFASVLRIIHKAGDAIMKVIIKPFLETGLPILLEKILSITGAIGRKLEEFADYVEESEIFETVLQNIVDGLTYIFNLAGKIATKIGETLTYIYNMPIVQSILQGIVGIIVSIPGIVTGAVESLKTFWDQFNNLPAVVQAKEFLSSVFTEIAKIANTKIGDFTTWLSGLKENPPDWSPFLNVLNTVIGALMIAAKWISENAKKAYDFVSPFIGSAGADILNFFKSLPGLIKGVFSGDTKLFEFKLPTVDEAWTAITTFFKSLYDRVVKFFEESGWSTNIGDYIREAVKLGIIFVIAKLLWDAGTLLQNLGKTTLTVRTTFLQCNKAINALTNNLKADIILKIAEAVGILALSLVVLCLVPTGKLETAAGALFLLMVGLKKIVEAFSKIGTNKYTLKIESVADALRLALSKFAKMAGLALLVIGITGGLLMLAVTIMMIINILNDENKSNQFVKAVGIMIGGFLLLATMVTILMGIATAFSKVSNKILGWDLMGMGVAMIGLSAGMILMAIALQKFSDDVSWEAIGMAGLAMVSLMLAMAAMVKVVQDGGAVGAAVYFIAMALALNLLLIPLNAITKIWQENGNAPLIWFAGLAGGFLVLSTIMAALSEKVDVAKFMIKLAAAVLIMAASFAIVAQTLMMFTKFDAVQTAGEMALAIGILTVTVAILGVIANLAKNFILPIFELGVTFLTISAALLVFAAALLVASVAVPAFFNALAQIGELCEEKAPQIAMGVAAMIMAIAAGIIVAKGAMALAGSNILQALAMGFANAAPSVFLNIGSLLLLGLVFLIDLLEAACPKVVDGLIRITNAIADSLMGRKDEIAAGFVRIIYAIWSIIIQAFAEIITGFVGMLVDLPVIGDVLKFFEVDTEAIKKSLDDFANKTSEALDENYKRIGRDIDEKNKETAEQVRTGSGRQLGAAQADGVAQGYEESSPAITAAVAKSSEDAQQAIKDTGGVAQAVEEDMEAAKEAADEGGEELAKSAENTATGINLGFLSCIGIDSELLANLQNADGTFNLTNLPDSAGILGTLLSGKFGENLDLSAVTGEQLGSLTNLFDADEYGVGDSLQGMVNNSFTNLDYSAVDESADTAVTRYGDTMAAAAENNVGATQVKEQVVEKLNEIPPEAERTGVSASKSLGNGIASSEAKEYVANSAAEVTSMVITKFNEAPEEVLGSGDKIVKEGWIPGINNEENRAASEGAAGVILDSTITGFTDKDDKAGKEATKIFTSVIDKLTDKEGLATSHGKSLGSDYAAGVGSKENVKASKDGGESLKTSATTGASGSYDPMNTEGSYGGEGYYDGLHSWADKIANEAAKIVRDAINAARREQDSASPSKKFRQLGNWAGEGYAIGVESLSSRVVDATSGLAKTGFVAMQSVVDKISDTMDTDLDYEPTIRPVMDLSNIENGTALINDAFNGMNAYIPINALRSTSKISGIGAGYFSADNANTSGNAAAGTINNFTQNNYSPKALSRLEIYRQTRNMFAMMKGRQANA